MQGLHFPTAMRHSTKYGEILGHGPGQKQLLKAAFWIGIVALQNQNALLGSLYWSSKDGYVECQLLKLTCARVWTNLSCSSCRTAGCWTLFQPMVETKQWF